jgi:gliding motility-associated-like protein
VLSPISRSVMCMLLVAAGGGARSQCINPIATFPHQEDFESAPNWTPGGTGSDWAWGTPAHPTINTAGGGVNSWCVGGLTGSFYNLGQSSWLQSPCFDMSTLDHPWISFKIFWECERQYDGMNLQYSLNGGSTWANVGAYGDPVDCLNDNWFNAASITNLSGASPKHGWSGRLGATSGSCQGGSGSGGWITAKHCVPAVANAPQVIFRFLFGAGTQCNNYDGVAIDDILVQEAAPTTAALTYTCNGNTIDFTDASPGCPSTWGWAFGDPGSGGLNATVSQNPSHTYPGPGNYLVSFSTDGPCSVPSSIDITIGILGVTVASTDPTCTGVPGSATATIVGGDGTETILWQPGGETTATITGLTAGVYSVTVSAPSGCSATASTTINAAAMVTAVAMPDTVLCAGASLALTATASGGIAPYAFGWSPAGPLITPTVGGTYSVVATDVNGCMSPPVNVVVDLAPPIIPTATADAQEGCTPLCITFNDGIPGSVSTTWDLGDGVVLTGSTVTHCYLTNGDFLPTLIAVDGFGCTASGTADTIHATVSPVAAFTVPQEVFAEGEAQVAFQNTSTGALTFAWTFGDGDISTETSPTHTFTEVGCYPVDLQVIGEAGCADQAGLEICVEGSYALFAPNAFTPDGDGINDHYLPISTAQRPKSYEFTVFDRWGAVIFRSTDLMEGWNGDALGAVAGEGIYAWTIRLQDAFNEVHAHKGHVVLLR